MSEKDKNLTQEKVLKLKPLLTEVLIEGFEKFDS